MAIYKDNIVAKVVFISTLRNFTLGKEYDILDVSFNVVNGMLIEVVDDFGRKNFHSISLFKTREDIRDEKLNNILDNGKSI